MRQTTIILMLLLLAPALFAMRPMTDHDLSNISNPLSLGVNPDTMANGDRAAVNTGDTGCIVKFLQNGYLRSAYDSMCYQDILAAGEEPLSDRQPFGALYFILSGEQYEFYSTTDYLKDQRTLRENSGYASTDSPFAPASAEQQSSTRRSIEYPDGRAASSNDPIVVTTRLRTYYTNDTSSMVHNNSWVDIKVR